MRFRQHQEPARSATRRLLLLFVLTVVLTVVALNAVMALLWMLQVGGAFGFPRWFFETNTVVATVFILGGSWLESVQLRKGGSHVAQMVGGHELLVPADALQRRLRNINLGDGGLFLVGVKHGDAGLAVCPRQLPEDLLKPG